MFVVIKTIFFALSSGIIATSIYNKLKKQKNFEGPIIVVCIILMIISAIPEQIYINAFSKEIEAVDDEESKHLAEIAEVENSEQVFISDYSGENYNIVSSKLRENGLKVEKVICFDRNIGDGMIVTNMPQNALVDNDSVITFYVSMGSIDSGLEESIEYSLEDIENYVNSLPIVLETIISKSVDFYNHGARIEVENSYLEGDSVNIVNYYNPYHIFDEYIDTDSYSNLVDLSQRYGFIVYYNYENLLFSLSSNFENYNYVVENITEDGFQNHEYTIMQIEESISFLEVMCEEGFGDFGFDYVVFVDNLYTGYPGCHACDYTYCVIEYNGFVKDYDIDNVKYLVSQYE